MILYQLNDNELESIFHNIQLFTDTEFIGKTLERKIVNDAHDLTLRHYISLKQEPQLQDNEVYDELEKIYLEKLNRTTGNSAEFRVYSIILNLTQTINRIVKKALVEKQLLRKELTELESRPSPTPEDLEFKEVKSDILKKRIEHPVYHLVQVYPFIEHTLPDSETSYFEQF